MKCCTHLLSQILEIALGESDIGGNNEFGLISLDRNVGAEVSGLAVDLNEWTKEHIIYSVQRLQEIFTAPIIPSSYHQDNHGTNLDTFVKIFLEVGGVHDAILDWLSAVEDKLVLDLLLGTALSFRRSLFRSTDSHFTPKI